MAYAGYLIQFKKTGLTPVNLPMKYIAYDSYSATPDQRMESKASRSVTGLLHRTTVSHKATKIEFNTPQALTNTDIATLNALIQSFYTNELERKITISFYDNETDSYRDAECYMPDVQYPIERVDNNNNIIYYKSIRYAFIEY